LRPEEPNQQANKVVAQKSRHAGTPHFSYILLFFILPYTDNRKRERFTAKTQIWPRYGR
jgi:hypothetical protein